MRYRAICCFLVILFCNSFTKAWSQELISSAGDMFSNSSLQMQWSLGESVIETYTDGQIMLTEGFHQPYLITPPDPEINILVYPNPFDLFLFIELTALENEQMYLEMCDISGRLIFLVSPLKNFNRLITGDMSDGIYMVRIYNSRSTLLKTVKIVKLFQP